MSEIIEFLILVGVSSLLSIFLLIVLMPLLSISGLLLNRLILFSVKLRNTVPVEKNPIEYFGEWWEFWENFYRNNKIEREE